MKKYTIGLMVIASFLLAFPCVRGSQAQDRGPSTPEERAKAVKIAHSLENDPLAKDAKEQREWVMQWIVEIPDITVNVCFEYFGKVPQPPRGHSTEIVRQMIISTAAFMIEHPDKAKDEQAAALAGLLGSIKAYQAILKEDASARWEQMDKLVEMREQGKLDDFVADTRRKCAQEGEEPDPDTIRAGTRTPAVLTNFTRPSWIAQATAVVRQPFFFREPN
jgi:hypothetical protein